MVIEKPQLGTSPANFSFLAGDKLSRSNSTSFIHDIKKTHSKMVSESPASPITQESNSSSDQSNTEDNKAKYRRCSSLKSGKTPPGTPGRRKIVR